MPGTRVGSTVAAARVGLTARRALGATLLVGAYVPLHRLLDPARAGPAGLSTLQVAEAAWSVGVYGTLIVLGVAFLGSRLLGSERLTLLRASAGHALARPSAAAFAVGCGLVAMLLSAAVALVLFDGLPTSVDEMAQLLHARALVAGSLAVPLPGAEATWTIQNGAVTPEGWAAIYPPLHTIALAAGLAVGASWVVGPLAVGVATAATAASLELLLGVRPGRAGGALLAVAPFWLLIGGTHLSHTTAAAGLALVLWTGLRARDGRIAWAFATGAAVGVAVCSRPWIGLVSSAALLLAVWWPGVGLDRAARLGVQRLVALAVGGLPFAALLVWWNARLFGHPLELGYAATFGPAHGLGFHVDPWGNVYGVVEALAYTGADLVQLGAHLLETPLPLVALVGAGLVSGSRARGRGPLTAWIVAALGANALYWHHGIHMGPRMLYESVPAWIGLAVASAALLTGERTERRLRAVSSWSLAVMAGAALMLAPGVMRAAATGAGSDGPGRGVATTLPVVPWAGPALVFVHGSWSSRLAARLTAAGMRRDSVETALRRNDVCQVDRYTRWREADGAQRDATPPALDLRALPGSPPHLETLEVSPGNFVRVAPGVAPDAECRREASADRYGTIELEPLAWQAPPLSGDGLVVGRDLGPTANESARSALGRPSYVYVERGEGGGPALLGYDQGMRLLWGGRGP